MKVNRTSVLTCAALLLCLLASACTASRPAPRQSVPASSSPPGAVVAAPRPNIVFVLTDDLSWNLVSRLPHVRAMQRAGTTMRKFYVVDSLCCPSRAATFTGQYPHDDGVITNFGALGGYGTYTRLGDEHRSFAVSLQRAGYRTAMMGKYLNGYLPTEHSALGWDEWDVTGSGYSGFDYMLNHNNAIRPYGNDPQSYLTDVLSTKAASFIDASTAARKPFMLEVASFAPHHPYTPPPRYAHIDNSLTYPRSPAYDTLPTNAARWLAPHLPITGPEKGLIDQIYRQRVRASLGVDDLIGHLQATLQARGVAGNTYFVFSSDNGYHMGEYRLAPGKQTAFDTDINVPLIVTGPGVPHGRVTDQLASNIDLSPTFLGLAGASAPDRVDGVDMASVWHGATPASWQQAVLIEHHGPNSAPSDPDRQVFDSGRPPTYEAVRTADALYVHYVDGEEEYYDTATDPYELHNLAARGVPLQLRTALAALHDCRGAEQCQAAAQLG